MQELFQSKILPKLEGELHIRDGKKSGWKKYVFSLRASGLYYSKTGKLSSRDISRLVEWKDVECYTGTQYKKFYRAPGQFCFSLVVSDISLQGVIQWGRGEASPLNTPASPPPPPPPQKKERRKGERGISSCYDTIS